MLEYYPVDRNSEFDTRERCSITELLNVPAFEHFSVAHCRVEKGVTTELHSLTDTEEVYVVLQGAGMMSDGAVAGRAIGPLDCVHIPAGHPQRVQNVGEEDLLFLAICAKRFKPEAYVALDSKPA